MRQQPVSILSRSSSDDDSPPESPEGLPPTVQRVPKRPRARSHHTTVFSLPMSKSVDWDLHGGVLNVQGLPRAGASLEG